MRTTFQPRSTAAHPPRRSFASKIPSSASDVTERLQRSAPYRNLSIKAEPDLPHIPIGSLQNFRFIRHAEEGPNRHYRHEVGLYEEIPTGRKVFLKEIGSTEVQRALLMEGKFTTDDARFLVYKEVLAGRLARILLGERHVPLTWVVEDHSLGKPTYYLASEEIPYYISMATAAAKMGFEEAKDLFYVDKEGYTRIMCNKNPRAGYLLHGRLASKFTRDFLGEGDETIHNVGIAYAGPDAGYVKNIDLECCFRRKPNYTAQELVDGYIYSVISVLNLEFLKIARRAEVKEQVIRHIASIPDAIFHREFRYAFGDIQEYPPELREKINDIKMGLFETLEIFREAKEIYDSRKAGLNTTATELRKKIGAMKEGIVGAAMEMLASQEAQGLHQTREANRDVMRNMGNSALGKGV